MVPSLVEETVRNRFAELDGFFRTLRIIHFAMCGSVFVYGLLAYLMIE